MTRLATSLFFLDVKPYVVCICSLKALGNCQRPVFSLGLSQYNVYKNKPVKIWTQLVIEVARK